MTNTQEIIKEFREKFCNDHNGEVRFMRSIFYDEKDGAEQILSFLTTKLEEMEKEINKRHAAEIATKESNWMQRETVLKADIQGALGHMEGCGHEWGYLKKKYSELSQQKEK